MAISADAQSARAYIMQPGEGDFVQSMHVRFVATDNLTGGRLMYGEVINPGPGGPPLHLHRGHDEFYFVVAGRYRFRVGDEVQEGTPGTFAYVPRGVAHSFASIGHEVGRVIIGNTPAGLERFVRRLGELDASGAGAEEVEQLFNEFDSEIVGPSLV